MSCSARPTQERAWSESCGSPNTLISPVGDPQQVADGADQRRLAGAVGAEQAEERARRDLEVEVLERERAVRSSAWSGRAAEGGMVAIHAIEAIDRRSAADEEAWRTELS